MHAWGIPIKLYMYVFILILDDKMTAYVVGEGGVPQSESADCIGGSTVHLTGDLTLI